MILFEHIIFLPLLILIVPLIYISHYWKRRGGRILISYKIYHDKPYFRGSLFWNCLSFCAYTLLWISLAFMILALANPGVIQKHQIMLKDSSAIMILLDVSPSMAAKDSGQHDSRFEIAKGAIQRFLSHHEGNSIGLITFGREAAVRIPLTRDYHFFQQRLDHVWLLEHGDGTNIGMALGLAALQLQRSGAGHKSIILITDGANNIGEFNPEDAIILLQSLGIQAYTVGVGTQERLRISVWDKKREELLTGFVDDAYDEELMRAIALETGGYFFKSESAGAFDAMFSAIEQQHTQDGLSRTSVTTTSSRDLLLQIALILLLSWVFMRYVILREVF
ncbi:VWA domain-containing protein [Entomospira entomophila]|uniref:VWA domain-containing protein n=1 Tax=Entomospira entomophila TaxID=2719988 RepID=A0A968G8V6_9SPIO|nr:VWA domain-containing protein [Entomospira entomophilus]NIZ40700.1 VWA domain-containing protein [Entomospira entomophilus]WDI34913.1 VWA domain-containing protein [Entomospira entomophilus]